MSTVSLTAQMTSNLLSLQGTAKLMGITQERLATGKKVNSAIDDPVAFFDADAHYQLASDYATFKNGMSEAVQTIKAATDTIESIKNLLNQMKSLATSAKSAAEQGDANDLKAQFTAVREQIDFLAGDAIYKGINLLQSDTLNVVFNVEGEDLEVAGFDGDASGLGVVVAATAAWGGSGLSAALTSAQISTINTAIDSIDDAIATLRSQAKTLASNLSIVTTRQDFTDKMIATLKIGGDNLTLADMNEEGANMLMLQTRQALGIQSLSMASQSAQQVLQLFG
jgi:flagellin-like hook-associated protein FlgL